MTYHHFKGNALNRSEKIEAWVAGQILDSNLPNERRESSLEWELKHSSGVIQMARLLAQKRGVNEELAVIAAALHDVYVIVDGSYDAHAVKGAEIARKLLGKAGAFSARETDAVCNAIASHSDKHIYGNDALAELVKDADCADCFFYGDDIYDEKPPAQRIHYFKRIINIRKELGLPERKGIAMKLQKLGGIQ